ncbi:unnamed protein product [Brugia timori]|uniref:Uncharacterized protein n=1 Tax=Brugia timori TaxID=42155 RepID=A0A0R3RA95_9BILA|nr:unnamed protein product [Brugia timori]
MSSSIANGHLVGSAVPHCAKPTDDVDDDDDYICAYV